MSTPKKLRKNYSIRLQPYEQTLLAEVIDYLSSLDRDEARKKVEDILVTCLLPLARNQNGDVSPEKLRLTTLESCNALMQYDRFLRQVIVMSVDLPTGVPMLSRLDAHKSSLYVTDEVDTTLPRQGEKQQSETSNSRLEADAGVGAKDNRAEFGSDEVLDDLF